MMGLMVIFGFVLLVGVFIVSCRMGLLVWVLLVCWCCLVVEICLLIACLGFNVDVFVGLGYLGFELNGLLLSFCWILWLVVLTVGWVGLLLWFGVIGYLF